MVGIFTERGYARKVPCTGKSSKDLKVHEVMSTTCCGSVPSATNAECMALMTEKRIRHLPVMEAER